MVPWPTFISLAFLPALCFAKLTLDYERGPLAIGEHASLSWTVDIEQKTIAMALEFKDNALRTEGTAWLGIGVGEDNSGGMLGADIFSSVFEANVFDSCEVKNRYVPFTPYPIKGAFPEEDICQSDKSWALVSCTRDTTAGAATLEVRRPLEAYSIQDRAITHGEQVIMYAFGGSNFSYHAQRRQSTRITLFEEDGSYPTSQIKPIPKDVVQQLDVVASNYSVPNGTRYACTTTKLNIPPNTTRYFVGADPILNQTSGTNKAHHFLVYMCEDNEFSRSYNITKDCDGGSFDPRLKCKGLMYGWAVGAVRMLLPDNVGMKIDNTNNMMLLETHFDNPTNDQDAVDISGARLYFAEEREIQAGVMTLGDGSLSLFGEKVKSGYNYTWNCPSSCTKTWDVEEINVVSSMLHMHTTGKHIYTNRFDSDGKFIETTNSIKFWSNDHQAGTYFKKPRKVRRGDILSTTCIFDTSSRPETKFGLRTEDEMCMDFLWYWPAVRREEGSLFFCAPLVNATSDETSADVCGNPALRKSYGPHDNTTFKDSKGLRVDFGVAPAGCSVTLAKKRADVATNSTSRPDCFPAFSTVQTPNGEKRMGELAVGDHVLVGRGQYSRVYMFTHRDMITESELVVIHTQQGELSLTGGHFLYVNGELQSADSVNVGDVVISGEEIPLRVMHVSRSKGIGLFNPQTEHGDIVVDGVRVSTYTSAIEHRIAHALLAPLRSAARWISLSLSIMETDTSSIVRLARDALA